MKTIYGPYEAKDGRFRVVIVKKKKGKVKKITQSYPRYLMEQCLGRKLTEEETVDHIDGNFKNNEISNLQILSREENAKKQFLDNPNLKRKYITFICPQCGVKATKPENQVKHGRNQGKKGPYCSRSCAGKANYKNPWT